MKPMKFFKSEKNQLPREFNFTAFSGLILIRISITLQLIGAACYNKWQRSRKLIYLNFDGVFSMFLDIRKSGRSQI